MSTEAERAYQRERYHRRRAAAIAFLGGKCVACGSTDELQIDHIDPTTKEYHTLKGRGRSEFAFWNEIKKCQLLCVPCHAAKTGKEQRKEVHGTWGMVRRRHCKCQVCKDFVKVYNHEYYKKKKNAAS